MKNHRMSLWTPILEIDGKRYQRICRSEEVLSSRARAAQLETGEEIALFRLASGECKAFSNVCLHLKLPVLADGMVDLDRNTVTCPLHGWCYSLENGAVQGGGNARLQEFAVVEQDGWIFVQLPEDTFELPEWLR